MARPPAAVVRVGVRIFERGGGAPQARAQQRVVVARGAAHGAPQRPRHGAQPRRVDQARVARAHDEQPQHVRRGVDAAVTAGTAVAYAAGSASSQASTRAFVSRPGIRPGSHARSARSRVSSSAVLRRQPCWPTCCAATSTCPRAARRSPCTRGPSTRRGSGCCRRPTWWPPGAGSGHGLGRRLGAVRPIMCLSHARLLSRAARVPPEGALWGGMNAAISRMPSGTGSGAPAGE